MCRRKASGNARTTTLQVGGDREAAEDRHGCEGFRVPHADAAAMQPPQGERGKPWEAVLSWGVSAAGRGPERRC